MSGNQPLEERVQKPEVEVSKATVRKVNVLDHKFHEASLRIQAQQILTLRPLTAELHALIRDSELQKDFWSRVMQTSRRLEEYVTAVDADMLSYTTNVSLDFFDVNDQGEGDPRNFKLVLDFAPNPYFTNTEVAKPFYWRKKQITTAKGKTRFVEGYASEPLDFDWKENRDPSRGLIAAANELYKAEQANKDKKRTDLPQYKKLGELLASQAEAADLDIDEDEAEDLSALSPAGVSFFAFFAFRGLDVTAEQSAAAVKADEERFQKMANGEDVDDEDDDEDDDDDEVDDLDDVEVFQDGEEVAQIFAEDIWPNALKLYTQSFEESIGFDDSDVEFDIEEDDEDDEEEEEGGNDRPRKKARLPPNPIRQRIHLSNHDRLLLQLAPHIIRLLPQCAHRPKYPIQLLILFMHQLHLPLLLHRRIVVLILAIAIPPGCTPRPDIIKLRRVGQSARRRRHGLLQLLPHLAPPLHFFKFEAVPVGVLFDGAHALHEVVEVRAEVCEGRLELGAGLLQFWVVGSFGERADA
ncbi:nucleosome assembly protein-domain-containing protein [Aspergillus floccosus]